MPSSIVQHFLVYVIFRVSPVLAISTKLLVYKCNLVTLLEQCPICSHLCDLTWYEIGTFVSVRRSCQHCHFCHTWDSQPFVKDIPAGNLNVSAAVYFNGISFSKINLFFKAVGLTSFCEQTFYRHVREYLQPTILHVWSESQTKMIETLQNRSGDLVLGGDMRADSPGHSAKYGSYTMMELRMNRVIHISLIQVFSLIILFN